MIKIYRSASSLTKRVFEIKKHGKTATVTRHLVVKAPRSGEKVSLSQELLNNEN